MLGLQNPSGMLQGWMSVRWCASSPQSMPIIFRTKPSTKPWPRRWRQRLEGDIKGLQRPRPRVRELQWYLWVMYKAPLFEHPLSSVHKIHGVLCPAYGAFNQIVWHSDQNCSNQAHLSNVQGLENVRATVWEWWVTEWPTTLHHTCQSLAIRHNVLGTSPGRPSRAMSGVSKTSQSIRYG